MNRLALRRPWCRLETVRSVYTPITPISRRTPSAHLIYNANGRSFASTSRWRQKQSSETPPASAPEPNEARDAESKSETTSPFRYVQNVPWYLQEASPFSESQQTLPRDEIPDLPERPPKILSPLLEHLFMDLGLDNLTLMDLRPLDNPPPLGADTIMIIGTARSVKHLNLSADRLCRYLRKKWYLSPHADGLLGRNEIKIKLRRKARRARVASQSGAMVDEKDDGITTGWICVNVGVVDKSAAPEPGARDFEGFGTVVRGTRIVVQMFTEEKRAQINLEGLWQKTLDRAEQAKKKHAEANSADSLSQEVRYPLSTQPSRSPSDRPFGSFTRTPATPPFQQRRQIHSGRPRTMFPSRQRAANTPIPSSFRPFVRSHAPTQASKTVDTLIEYVSALPDEQVRKELGTGPGDASSTDFLKLFFKNVSGFSAQERALAVLRLHCVAVKRRHPGYSKQGLAKDFEYCAALGLAIPDKFSFQVVEALLIGRPIDVPAESGGEVKLTLPREDIEIALDVLEHLSTQGTNLINLKMFNIIYEAATMIPDPVSPAAGEETDGENIAGHPRGPVKMERAVDRVSRMIDSFDFPFHPKHSREHMKLRFRNGDLAAFWEIWHKLPIMDRTRTKEDYVTLFREHARLGNENLAEACLMTWFPMMGREQEEIVFGGELRDSVLECIYLVNPAVEEEAKKNVDTPMVRLWKKCHPMPAGWDEDEEDEWD